MLRPCSIIGGWRETPDQLVADAVGQMGVAHGDDDRAMAKPLLDLADRDPAHHSVTCEAAAKAMNIVDIAMRRGWERRERGLRLEALCRHALTPSQSPGPTPAEHVPSREEPIADGPASIPSLGIEDADLAAWEAKPPKRKIRAVDTVRLRVFDLGDPEDLPTVVADIRQRHESAALADFALLKEVLLLAVSIQDAGLSRTVGRPLLQRLFDDIRHADTGFFCEMFVRSLEGLVEKHCAAGWPAEQRGRSNAKRAVTQFLKSHALGEDRVWQMLCLEYLRGISTN